MKRLALLTVFFYVCTFAAPPRAHAVAPVALIAAAAVGTAMMSASIGTYYAQNGVMPQYVTSTANAVASAADAVFQPSYLAKGVYHLFTPESLTTAKDYYLGKTAAIGAKIGDIVDFVKAQASGAYDSLRSLIDSHDLDPVIDADEILTGQTVVVDPSGKKRLVTGEISPAWYSSRDAWISGNKGGWAQGLVNLCRFADTSYRHISFWSGERDSSHAYNYYKVRVFGVSSTTNPENHPTPTIGTNYAALKSDLDQADMDAAVANDLRSAIAALPDSKVIPAPAVPGTVATTGAAPSITAAELAAALQANTLAVANAVAEQAAAIAAANPDDAAAQIAAAQAAAEAAKAAAAAEEAANEPEPDPEPSYPVPSTWYTKTCDLSNGLGSCIDYQQVINATSAFQSTALYQFPNLILQCLGYVEGDGCEYPPKISVDLFTRFSNGPISIDLSPFESVVKVMKFFFSILCLVGTGKATMTLFE